MNKNPEHNDGAGQPVRCSAWLGRWWSCRQGREMPIAANPLAGTVHRRHDGRPQALGAIWMRLEAGCRALPEHAHALSEPVGLWLRALKLLVKLGYLSLKARYLAMRIRKLTREKRDLLLQQVNHVLAQSGGGANPNNLFGGVECAHVVNRPNDPSSATRPTGGAS